MKSFLTATIILSFNLTIAQIPPTPPPTPKAYTTSHSSSSSSSISVKSTDLTYKFRANFDNRLTTNIKDVLVKRLSNLLEIEKDKNNSYWISIKDEEKIFDCRLSNGHLRIFLNKNTASKKLQEVIYELGEELKILITK